jgi:hypothetical protein
MGSTNYLPSIGRTQQDQITIKKTLNNYLYAEYGFDAEDEALISDHWPFELRPLGTIQMAAGDVYVFELDDGAKTCFGISGYSLTFYAADGMTFDQLYSQMIGSEWIAYKEPVDLNTVRLGYDDIPTIRQRRAAIEALAVQAFPSDPAPRICEGLFLRATQEYVALVQSTISGDAAVVGSRIEPHPIHISTQSAWRRLAFGIGQMIAEGGLDQS